MSPVRLAVVGAGLIGRRPAAIISENDDTELAAIADPAYATHDFARTHGADWFVGIDEMLEASRPEGVVIATPNQLHIAHGRSAVQAGVPALIEKPIADTVEGAAELVAAAEEAEVALLVGHHRRRPAARSDMKTSTAQSSRSPSAGAAASIYIARLTTAPWKALKARMPPASPLIGAARVEPIVRVTSADGEIGP